MSDTPTDDPPKRRPGRPTARPDGRPMTTAERQQRRRSRLVDGEQALDALIGLALARRALDDLVTARDGRSTDPDLHARYWTLFEAEQALCLALDRPAVWAHRKASAIRLGVATRSRGGGREDPPTPR